MRKTYFYFLLPVFAVFLSFVFAQEEQAPTEIIWDQVKTATITLTIEAPSKIIEGKSFMETAVIYWVDSNVLIKRIKEYYWNQFDINTDDLIKNIEKEHWIDVEVIKNIAQELQFTNPVSPSQKEALIEMITDKEIMNKREFVFWSIVIILCLYFLSYYLTNRELLHHRIHKHFRNTLILISLAGYALIVWVYVLNHAYNIHLYLPIDEFYQNLWIWLVVVFLWFSHALRYLFYYRIINKKERSHKIAHHHNINHNKISEKKPEHKTEHKQTFNKKHSKSKNKKTEKKK